MDKRFIIVHPSDIVQKGLHCLLREYFNVEFILLKSVRELSDYGGLSNLILVLFIDKGQLNNEVVQVQKRLKKQKNGIRLVGIGQGKNQLIDIQETIFIEDNSNEIIQKTNKLLEYWEERKDTLTDLSERERDVLKLVALGFQNKEIAEKLFISIHTVISHRKNITEKLGIKSISGLTVYAIINKLIDTENIDPTTLI